MIFRNYLRTSLAALGALAIASMAPAKAADIYSNGGGSKDAVYVAAPTWQGFYFGAHAGGAWSNFDNHDRNFFFDEAPVDRGAELGVPFDGRNLNGTGFFGGAQFGYNWQGGANCCFVYGLEVDIGGLDNGGRNRDLVVFGDDLTTGGLPLQTAIVRIKSSGGFYGDVTGRLGYTWGSALLYAKGGFAWLNANFEVTELLNGVPVFNNNNNSSNNTLTGWTLGAGIEYMLGTNWTVKVEYLHFDFGNLDRHCCNDTFVNDFHFHNDVAVDTVKVGINYLIHPAPVVLPYK